MENCRSVIDQAVSQALNKGRKVSFLPMHAIDELLAKQIAGKYPRLNILPIPRTLEEALSAFNDHAFAVGERLHFMVLSLLAKRAFLAINYRPKHVDLLKSVNMIKAGVDPQDMTLEMLNVAVDQAADGKFEWNDCQKHIENFCNFQRNEYARFLHNGPKE
jgi:polysaccharide pyruvyl transferase WcaK-like protein